MNGLEAVELKLSDVLIDNDSRRFDSEYFEKRFLKFINRLQKLDYDILEGIADVRGGKRLPLGESFSDEGIPYIRAEDNKNGFIDYERSPLISLSLHQRLKAYQTKYNDILLTIVGNSIGDVGIIKFELERCNLTENCIKIINLKDTIKPDYLFTFLISQFGQLQIIREKVGTAQPKLAIERIRRFRVPILLDDFQLRIEDLIKISYQKLKESKQLYKEAEELLLSELGLLDFVPNNDNIAIKSFSNSFSVSGRLDSEYYQPKYNDIISHIKQTKHDKLGGIVDDKKSIEPGSEAYQEEGIPFVRVSNVSKFEITPPDIHLPHSFFTTDELETLQPRKDTILLSKDGTVGIAYCIKEDANIITSGALLHLTIKSSRKAEVLPEYLTLVLNSKVVQMQAERDAGGSIIQHWKPSEIQEVLIPILDNPIQEQIEAKIKQSFALKEQSKQLLELAKRAVEVAIEKNEDEAIRLIYA